jgi:hypothetical protein
MKIFIPTVNRVDNQITYNNLPDVLKKDVVMVVQAWERPQYTYPCEYLVLPEEINLDDYLCLPKTRLAIYQAGRNMKYAVLDDDLTFGRRNAKYWTGVSNMEMSKRKATEEDVLEMFQLYDEWLDDSSVTVCGPGHAENPPQDKPFSTNSSLSSAIFVNGNDFADILDDLELTRVKVAEDAVFLLSLLSRGYGNRVSQEFIFHNHSVHKKDMESTVWDEQTYEQTLHDHKIVESMFPGIFSILYDEKTGERVGGGFRNFGKSKIRWSKAYQSAQVGNLEHLFND